MTKKDLVDYILDTPQNVNPAILNQMLDEVGGGGTSLRSKEITLVISNVDDTSGEVSFGFGFYTTEQDQEIIDSGINVIHGFLKSNTTPYICYTNAYSNNMPSDTSRKMIFTAYFLDDSNLVFGTNDIIESAEGECELRDPYSYKVNGNCHFNLKKRK